MITLGVSQRDRRTLLVGAFSVGAIVATGKGIPAVRAWETERVATAVEARAQVNSAASEAGSLAELRDSAAARTRRLDSLHAALLRAPNPEAAAASLASLVEKIAREGEVDILTVTLRPDTVIRSGLARVAVLLSAETDVNGLVELIYSMETHRTPLLVRELSVSQPDPAAPTSKTEALRFDLLVQTLARIKPVASKEGRK